MTASKPPPTVTVKPLTIMLLKDALNSSGRKYILMALRHQREQESKREPRRD